MSWVWFSLFGALLSGGLVTWLAPAAITWYFKPPAAMGFSCEQPIQWALERLRLVQLVGLAVGALAGLFVRFAFRKTTHHTIEIAPHQ